MCCLALGYGLGLGDGNRSLARLCRTRSYLLYRSDPCWPRWRVPAVRGPRVGCTESCPADPQVTFIPFNEPKFDDEEREKSIAAKVKDPRINMFPPPIGRAMNAVGAGTALRVSKGHAWEWGRTGRLTLAGWPLPFPFFCPSAVTLTTTPPRPTHCVLTVTLTDFPIASAPLTRTPLPTHPAPRAC